MPAARKSAAATKTDNRSVTATFVQEKSTKNSVRYEEEVENGKTAKIGTYFYIKKELFTKLGEPEAIEVTVTAESTE
jgi:hypothetical protein